MEDTMKFFAKSKIAKSYFTNNYTGSLFNTSQSLLGQSFFPTSIKKPSILSAYSISANRYIGLARFHHQNDMLHQTYLLNKRYIKDAINSKRLFSDDNDQPILKPKARRSKLRWLAAIIGITLAAIIFSPEDKEPSEKDLLFILKSLSQDNNNPGDANKIIEILNKYPVLKQAFQLLSTDNYEAAYQKFDEFVVQHPKTKPIYLCVRGLLTFLKNEKDYKLAIGYFEDAININGRFSFAHYNKARVLIYVYFNINRDASYLQQALISLNTAKARGISNEQLHIMRGLIWSNWDTYTPAEKLALSNIIEPDKRLHIILSNLDVYTLAIKEYQAAIQINPNKMIYHIENCRTLYLHGRYSEAIIACNVALDIEECSFFHIINALCHLKENKYDKAINDLTHAQRCGYDKFHSDTHIANSYVLWKRYDKAIDRYTSLINEKNSAELYTKRGFCHEQSNDMEAALADYVVALKLDPANLIAHQRKAQVLIHLERHEDAKPHVEFIVNSNATSPDNIKLGEELKIAIITELEREKDPEYLRRKADVNLKQKKYKIASDKLAKAVNVETNPEKKAEIHYLEGVSLLGEQQTIDEKQSIATEEQQPDNKTDKPKAHEVFERAIELGNKNAETYYLAAVSYEKEGKPEKAKEYYDEVIKLDSNFRDAHARRGASRLEIIKKTKNILENIKELISDLVFGNSNNKKISAENYNSKGILCIQAGELFKALLFFNKALALNPKLTGARLNKNIIENLFSNNEKAIQDVLKDAPRDMVIEYEKLMENNRKIIQNNDHLQYELYQKMVRNKAYPESKDFNQLIHAINDADVEKVMELLNKNVDTHSIFYQENIQENGEKKLIKMNPLALALSKLLFPNMQQTQEESEKRLKIATQLIQHRTALSAEKRDNIIARCLPEIKPELENHEENDCYYDFFIDELLGLVRNTEQEGETRRTTMATRLDVNISRRYRAHLKHEGWISASELSIKLDTDNRKILVNDMTLEDLSQDDLNYLKNSFEGWQPHHFMVMRIRTYLKMLALWENHPGYFKEKFYANERKEIKKIIKNEISVCVEIYNTCVIMEEIQAINNRAERRYFNNGKSISAVDKENEKIIRDKLIDAVSFNIYNNILKLQNNKSYYSHFGTGIHSLYMDFKNLNNQIVTRVDNLGSYNENHEKDPQNQNFIVPCELENKFNITIGEGKKELKDFLDKLLEVYSFVISIDEVVKNEQIHVYNDFVEGKKLRKPYNEIVARFYPTACSRDNTQNGKDEKQKFENCVVANFNVGLRIRIKAETITLRLINLEIAEISDEITEREKITKRGDHQPEIALPSFCSLEKVPLDEFIPKKHTANEDDTIEDNSSLKI